MSVEYSTLREALSRLRSAALNGGLLKHCWQEGASGFGGGIGPGPHFRRPDCYDVVSPSEEENLILFLFARVISPPCIVEYGTGTGVSTACLAMGAPHAKLYTADLSQPHDLSATAAELWKRLELKNIAAFKEDWICLPRMARSQNWMPGIIFCDGALRYPDIPNFPGATPGCIYVLHDFYASEYSKSSECLGWHTLNSSSLLAFFSTDRALHAVSARLASCVASIERIRTIQAVSNDAGSIPT
jgi:hypothetical protein